MDTSIGESDDMKTLSSCIRMLERKGFTVQFKANNMGVKSLGTDKQFAPGQVRILNFYRFEGASDPDDNAILYAIETEDGERGTLIDAYGAYDDAHISTFIKAVENIEKKVDKSKSL